MEYFLQQNRRALVFPEPAMTFNAPTQGHIEIKDLNGDGRSDLLWQRRISAGSPFSCRQPSRAKGKNP